MKIAFTTASRPIKAAPDAPTKAVCPQCGGTVTLRHRKRMNNEGISYFWRHSDNHQGHRCRARTSPVLSFQLA